MWGRANALPSITSYAEAKRRYENTKPIRGNPAFRPLDRRSIHAKGSIKQVGDNYIIQLYNTNIVTYYPNGDVLLGTGNYSTLSTADAIGQVSPFSCWTSKGRICVCNRHNRQGIFLVQPTLLFKRDAEGIYRPENPPIAVVCKKRVLKDKAKLARTIFKQVPIFIETFSKVFVGGVKPTTGIFDPQFKCDSVSEEHAVKLAWNYVRTGGWPDPLIVDDAEGAISAFWKDVYNKRGVIEQYTTDLPLGEV